MDMIPQLPPPQGHHIRKGRASFAIPRRAAQTGRSLLDQLLGGQRDDRVEAQQRWGGAGNSAIIPLALRFHPQMRLHTHHLDNTTAILKDELLERILTRCGYGMSVLGLYTY